MIPGNGLYVNYKGDPYEVVGVAVHKTTSEELVVYRALYGDRLLWARPRGEFLEDVEWNGQRLPRFRLKERVAESDSQSSML